MVAIFVLIFWLKCNNSVIVFQFFTWSVKIARILECINIKYKMIGSYTCACMLPTTKLCCLTKLQVLIECGRSRQVRSSYQFVISFLYCQILVPIFGGLYSISLACLEISLMSKSVRMGDLFFGKLNHLSALGATFVALILLEPIVVITTTFQFQFQLCCILKKK